MEKVIVHISHDRHREDIIKVYKYSENGYQYGLCEEYYDSYSIAEIEKEVIK